MDFEACSEVVKHPKITVADPDGESDSKLLVNNPDRVEIRRIRVDGCLIDDHRERCDVVLEIDEQRCAIYVELKGTKTKKALNQLVKTLGYLVDRHKDRVKIFHIVGSSVPKKVNVSKLKKEMLNKHNVILFVKTRKQEISVDKRPYKT